MNIVEQEQKFPLLTIDVFKHNPNKKGIPPGNEHAYFDKVSEITISYKGVGSIEVLEKSGNMYRILTLLNGTQYIIDDWAASKIKCKGQEHHAEGFYSNY